jgi:hypothetical protein
MIHRSQKVDYAQGQSRNYSARNELRSTAATAECSREDLMTSMRTNSLLAGLATALLMVSLPAFSETMTFEADMKGSSEVPPTDSAATGSAEVSVDTATKKLSWTVTSTGLSGEATAAHFHGPAAPGANADPAVDISSALAKGSADLSDQQLADLQAGKWYINIHTAKFPDGEIRGQVEMAK